MKPACGRMPAQEVLRRLQIGKIFPTMLNGQKKYWRSQGKTWLP